jgi:histidyl-tRNA synthetase
MTIKPTKIQGVKGMNDLLPDESALQELFEDIIRDILRNYGYRLIRTPIVEPTGLFIRGLGEVTDIVEKEMYSFTDSLNADRLTLRPEGTAGTVRSAIEHNWLYNAPQRVWTMGAMFRHERPQKGRYRQFHQVSVEAMGFEGPDVEAEHIILLARLWRRLGLLDAQLHINSIGDASERTVYRKRLIEHFEHHLEIINADEEAKRRLYTNPLRLLDSKNPAMQAVINTAPKLIECLGETSLAHFEQFKNILNEAGITYTINPRLVRGMDYYNRTVFEWITTALGGDLTIAGGGRYDGLFEQLGGKPTPACGFALGVERVMLVWQHSLLTRGNPQPDGLFTPLVYLVHSGIGTAQVAAHLAETLRDANVSCIMNAGSGSFKSQLKRANDSGVKYTLIIGEAELAASQVAIKTMATGQQHTITLQDTSSLLLYLGIVPSKNLQ